MTWTPPDQQQSWIKPMWRGDRKPARIYPRMAQTPQPILARYQFLQLVLQDINSFFFKRSIISPIRERLLYDGGSTVITFASPPSRGEMTTPEKKKNIRRCRPYARELVPQAVLVNSKMRLTLHATCPTPHGTWRLVSTSNICLVGENPT